MNRLHYLRSCVLVILLILSFILCSCNFNGEDGQGKWKPVHPTNGQEESDNTSTGGDDEYSSENVETDEFIHYDPTEPTAPYQQTTVSTIYGEFILSGNWFLHLQVGIMEEDCYTIRAFCEKSENDRLRLFDVSFGDGNGDLLGYIRADGDEHLPVHIDIVTPEFTEEWSEQDRRDYFGMQAEINSILSMMDIQDEIPSTDVEPKDVIEVVTSYFSFEYTVKSKDQIRLDIKDAETVVISVYGTPTGMDEMHLFDMEINGDNEIPVGYYNLQNGTTVSVDFCNFNDYDTSTWDPQAAEQMNEMMESINDILFALEQTGNFQY